MRLEARALGFGYPGKPVGRDVSFALGSGEVLCLLGPNGSGKTTALRLILGFLRPTSGTATVAGHDCWADGVEARKHVAYLPAELRLYENMNGRQLIRFLCDLRRQPLRRDLDGLARRLDIDLGRPIAHLSSGMKRKVALLQVLVPQAPLLILDEPTNTLDPTMREELLGQLRWARGHGQAVLFSSHVLGEVEAVCDRVAVLKRGRLAHLQIMKELRETCRVRARFDRPPGVGVAQGVGHFVHPSLRSGSRRRRATAQIAFHASLLLEQMRSMERKGNDEASARWRRAMWKSQ